jgi:hypothetical protein
MDDTRKENNKEGRLINMAITEEEKERRRKEYEKNRNICLSDYDDDYIQQVLSNRPDPLDLIYERWINGEITSDEVRNEVNKYIHSF